ncbi:hypothetical protein [Falsirhodobacter xinxiangensis]|uniref:hypothetical protein n=1 Tax=Falsirhodobacter xinxiangensis TaxID=2530049 RepID=UPI0010AB2BF4|nr:hypothetical protein [Rhodobacter xinxiangensis]
MRGICLAFLLMATTASAQTVQVRSGEHPGFTRLAMDLPAGTEWKLGRVDGGYGLVVDAALDISRVYRLIGRQRLARLSAEPGQLNLGIDCACHVTAFETKRGTVVLDIRAGAAPAGSRFEAPLVPVAAPVPLPADTPVPLPAPAPVPPPAPGYDWQALPPPSASLADTTLDPLREALLRKLADGAARGVVDIVDRIPPRPEPAPMPEQVRIGEAPGFLPDPAQPITPEGRACIANDRVAIGAWGSDIPAAEEIARARAALVTEFDQPDPEAIARAVRYYLHLGFGAEARQLAASFPINPHDRALWEAMANILDGRQQTSDILATMASCDADVAMWAILAAPTPTPGEVEQTEAALRSFSALPVHMRQHLGPQLAERFAARQDANAALMVREAVTRGAAVPTDDTRMMTALAQQDDTQLRALVAEGGTRSGEALIALAGRRLDAQEPLDQATVTALAALRHERRGGQEEADVARLHVLGLASIGDFAAAFAGARNAPDATPALWDWLARTGGDGALLTHAVLPEGSPLPEAAATTRLSLADRLTGLGLAGPALLWLERGDRLAVAPPEERLAAARARMQQRDARAVLPLIARMEGEAADRLRIAALEQLGTPATETTALPAPSPVEGGALARGRAMVGDAADARARIEALLAR